MKTLFFVDKDQSKIHLFINKFGDEYEIKGFESGKQCLQQIKQLEKNNEELPEVIIVDYALPDMNGLKLQNKLQKFLEDTKIILLVPREKDEVLLKIIRKGFMNYIMKDLNYLSILSSMLERRNTAFI